MKNEIRNAGGRMAQEMRSAAEILEKDSFCQENLEAFMDLVFGD